MMQTMTHEQAKELVLRMANGTATPEEESMLEAYALSEWGHDADGPSRYSESRRVVVLGDKTPNSAGQLHYDSVREAIEFMQKIARTFCDVHYEHKRLGLMSNGEIYDVDVYEYEHSVHVDRPDSGNWCELSVWYNREYDLLARFPCTQDQTKHTGSYDQHAPQKYLFDRESYYHRCANCTAITNITVFCDACLEKAIQNEECSNYND